MVRGRFRIADTVQQMVGGFLLAGPFVVTEEVWRLAEQMHMVHALLATGIVFVIGYGALYRADRGRDVDDDTREPKLFMVPVRFISLLLVAYTAVVVLVVVFRAPATFEVTVWNTVKAVSIATIFSVIGAATADSIY